MSLFKGETLTTSSSAGVLEFISTTDVDEGSVKIEILEGFSTDYNNYYLYGENLKNKITDSSMGVSFYINGSLYSGSYAWYNQSGSYVSNANWFTVMNITPQTGKGLFVSIINANGGLPVVTIEAPFAVVKSGSIGIAGNLTGLSFLLLENNRPFDSGKIHLYGVKKP